VLRFADRLVYFPSREHDGGSPARLGLAYEDLRLTASDGVSLHAWWVPAREPRLALIFLHGNAGNISHRLDKLAVLHGLGVSILLLDYRGYGASEGQPDEAGLYRDAEAAWDWLAARPWPPERIVAYGESLGGTVAVELGVRRPLGGLVLESTPTSILAVARHHYPLLPVGLFLAARYDALARIGHLRTPVLVLHSPDDEIVPFAMAEALHGAAAGSKRLVRLAGGHNDAFLRAGATYREALRDFLSTLEGEKAPSATP